MRVVIEYGGYASSESVRPIFSCELRDGYKSLEDALLNRESPHVVSRDKLLGKYLGGQSKLTIPLSSDVELFYPDAERREVGNINISLPSDAVRSFGIGLWRFNSKAHPNQNLWPPKAVCNEGLRHSSYGDRSGQQQSRPVTCGETRVGDSGMTCEGRDAEMPHWVGA